MDFCDAEEIKLILDAAVNQQNNNESLIPTVNVLSTKEVMLLYIHLLERTSGRFTIKKTG